MSRTGFFRLIAVISIALLVIGCAPQPAPSGGAQPGAGALSQPAPQAAPAAPKRLTIALAREVGALVRGFGGGLSSDAGAARDMAHDYLVQLDAAGNIIPRVATEVISVQTGTWRTNPDGTMDTTWKLRPNVFWHDGTPFTAADILFAVQAFRDPQATPPDGQANRLMESVTAPDPLTVEIHWNQIYVDANQAPNLTPLPKHLLEEVFNADKDAFYGSPYLSTEFVGLGPYKVINWERGSFVEFAAFDQYYLGRPKIDRVTLRFLPDPNTMVANILSESVDVILNSTADADISLAAEVESRWQGTGNKVLYRGGGGVGRMEVQLRPEFARPQNGLPNRMVRQAMYHATDRRTYNEIVNLGKPEIADSWVPSDDPLRKQVEAAIPQYPFDLNRAQQLFTQAGWTRGPDGVLVHAPSGERFAITLHGPAGTSTERKLNVLGDSWKQSGMEISFNLIPSAQYNDLDYRTHLPGAGLSTISGDGFTGGRNYLHSKTISTAANRWTGANRSGYSNARVDAILDQLAVTIDDRQRLPLHRDLLAEVWTDVPFIPLEFSVTPVLHLRRVTGIPAGTSTVTVNITQWDVQ
jgi:peptide/nickel transport system substrate-binding protein